MSRVEAAPPPFQLWIRRDGAADPQYAVRFEVKEGKGILRVSRPGMLIDPPARAQGLEERLTAAQLRSSRFLLVWDGGRARQAHLFTRMTEPELSRVRADTWWTAEVVVDAGIRQLQVPAAGYTAPDEAPTAAVIDPAAELDREPEDLVTEEEAVPINRLLPPDDDDLAAVFGVDDADVAFAVDTPRTRMETHHVMLGAVEAVTFLPAVGGPPSADHDTLEAGEADEALEAGEAEEALEAGEADELHAATTAAFADQPPEATGALEATSGPEATSAPEATSGPEVASAPEATNDPIADAKTMSDDELEVGADGGGDGLSSPVGDVGELHDRQTTLVRHLRRQVADQRKRILELEARVRELEAVTAPPG